MNKRETFIALAALFAAIYGIMDYFVFSRPPSQESPGHQEMSGAAQADELVKVSGASLDLLDRPEGSRDLAYVKKMAESPWPKDPFISRQKTDKVNESEQNTTPDMIFAGFIQAGDTRLAIIDGIEYGIGEKITDTGFTVHRVTAAKVVLRTRFNTEVTLYLEQE